MIEVQADGDIETTAAQTNVLPPGGWGPFRRRSMGRVLVICGLVVTTVWGIQYAGAAGELAAECREAGRHAPLSQLLDPLLIARACPIALVMLLAAIVGFYSLLRLKAAAPIERTILRALGTVGWTSESAKESRDGPLSREEREQNWTWIALGLAIVAAALVILESIQPFYFVQDDNFANVLPGVLQGCRSMFHGEFPDFDPCQYMGMPNAGKGIFALFYPPTIASYAVARYVLCNEHWTLDVFAAMHLLAGYVASYFAARRFGLRPALAFAMAIAFVLSGYILLVGRSWHAVLTLVLWLPLLFCSMEAWLSGRTGWRWLIASGLCIGGFYYMGFPQYWVYALFFMAATAATAVACGRVAPRQLIWPAAAVTLGVAIALPSLVVQLEITHGMAEKPANFGMGFAQGLLATIAPYPFSRAESFMGIAANRYNELVTQWYYAGTILMTGGLIVLGALLAYRCNRRWLAANPWTIAAVLSLWLGLGTPGLLWTMLGRLPVLRAVNHHPHRLLPFFVFFTLLIGGRFIERLLQLAGRGADFQSAVSSADWKSAPRKWERAIAAATALLMLYHVSLARNSLWCYGDRPYPPLPREIAARVLPSENDQAGRVLWHGPWRSGEPGYAFLLPHSLPSAYGALAFGGYDPIIESRPETRAMQTRFDDSPVAAAKAYGVRWILTANPDHYRAERGFWQAVWKNDWCFEFMQKGPPCNEERVLSAAQLRVARDELSLYELPGASPLAFDRAKPDVSLPIRFRGWGAEVDAPRGGPHAVVVNMVMRPWVRASAGGAILPTAADDWGRVEVSVPDGVTRFDVYYQLPWRRGLLLGTALTAATMVGMAVVKQRL